MVYYLSLFMARSRAVSVPLPAGASRMARSRVVSVPLPTGASRMAHSSAVSVLYLLEPVGWLILELLVSFTCWSQ